MIWRPPERKLIHPEWVQIVRALDWGFYPDPAVCLWAAMLGRRILMFKEKTWTRTIAKDVAIDIVNESKGMRIMATYCDPTMAIKTGADIYTLQDIFENNGVPLELSVNNREMFADAIHSALGEEISPGVPRIQFYRPGVPNLIKYLPSMTFDPNHPHRMADHKHDHLPVALAYLLMAVLPNTKPTKDSGQPWYVKAGYGPKHQHRVLGSESVRNKR